MAELRSRVQPNSYLFIRIPSDILRLVEIKPNTIIEIGRFGSFPANLLLDRPNHITYELLEPQPDEPFSRLRVVSPSELNADILAEEENTTSEARGTAGTPLETDTPTIRNSPANDTSNEAKNNRLIIDNPARQALTQDEIEELKKSAGGQEVIDRLIANHAGLDEKTVYSKAKYLLRKRKKYLKRFTILPMEIPTLIQWITSKESLRILEIRDETLGLLTAWSNVHVPATNQVHRDADGKRTGGGRWLLVEETAGLVAAAMAERMQILYPLPSTEETNGKKNENGTEHPPTARQDESNPSNPINTSTKPRIAHQDFLPTAETNTITIVHSATQPNISVLKYFGYDSNEPSPSHPLHTHLKSLSWLQLLHPEEDPTYIEPAEATNEEMKEWKSGKRGTYWRKRRRWQHCKAIVDETREGGFDGLVVATPMDPVGVLRHLVPLLRGGASIAIYSPTIGILVSLMDLYSKGRRAAYTQHLLNGEAPDPNDFPLDPRQLLAPMLQTSRIRPYQVLPGRTHPLMSYKGGSEGYIFTARKAIPLEGGVEARGNHASAKRRKTANCI